jgi:hypothetical protein
MSKEQLPDEPNYNSSPSGFSVCLAKFIDLKLH